MDTLIQKNEQFRIFKRYVAFAIVTYEKIFSFVSFLFLKALIEWSAESMTRIWKSFIWGRRNIKQGINRFEMWWNLSYFSLFFFSKRTVFAPKINFSFLFSAEINNLENIFKIKEYLNIKIIDRVKPKEQTIEEKQMIYVSMRFEKIIRMQVTWHCNRTTKKT